MITRFLREEVPRRRLISAVFAASLALVGGGWMWAAYVLGGAHQPLILHFNDYVRINLTGGLSDLAGFGILSLVMILTNFLISIELEGRDWFLGKLIAFATAATAVLIFIGFAAIITVN